MLPRIRLFKDTMNKDNTIQMLQSEKLPGIVWGMGCMYSTGMAFGFGSGFHHSIIPYSESSMEEEVFRNTGWI